MMRATRTGLIALAMCMTANAAHAQTVKNPKPVTTRDSCQAAPVYQLVDGGSPSPWRTTSSSAPGGYDASAPVTTCGSATRASPLTCVDASGMPQSNPQVCEPGARQDYESRTINRVYSDASTPFFTTATTVLGSGPMVTAVRIKSASADVLQIAEVEAYENSINLALAANGATATSYNVYESRTTPGKAIDGNRPAGFPELYHSVGTPNDSLTITLGRPGRLTSLTIYGRTDARECCGKRDYWAYELLSGNVVVGTGTADARTTGVATVPLSTCDTKSMQWRVTKASTAGICGTQTVQDTVECVSVGASGSTVVDPSWCNPAQKPASAPYQVTSRDGCGFDYTAGAWSTFAPSCGTVTQTRTVTCMGTDGAPGTDADCGRSLTPADPATPTSAYWNPALPWTGSAAGSIAVYKISSVCNLGAPADIQKDCDAAYLNRNGASYAYLKPRASRDVIDQRSCEATTPPSNFAWNTPVYTPDRTNVCGPNTRSGSVFCLKDGTTRVDDSFCDATKKPAATQSFDDTSGCSTPVQTVTSLTEIQLGTCNYTSSGGGRYACGDRYNYRPGPSAPYPGELCSGSIIAGTDRTDRMDGNYQTPNAGVGWSKSPVVANVPGARCVVHWRVGYSDSSRAVWQSAYYDGPATGTQGVLAIGRKP